MDTVNVKLTKTDVGVIMVALFDCRTPAGEPAWDHPNVQALRAKLSEGIRERDLAPAPTEVDIAEVSLPPHCRLPLAAEECMRLRLKGVPAFLTFDYKGERRRVVPTSWAPSGHLRGVDMDRSEQEDQTAVRMFDPADARFLNIEVDESCAVVL